MVGIEKGYSLVDTARLLGITVSTARLWARTGKIKARKIAGTRRWIIMESEIKRLQSNDADEN